MNFGRKKVYFFDLRQEAEIDADAEILQRVVDEAGVARLVAAHEAEQLADVGVLGALHLRVEHAARELGGDDETRKSRNSLRSAGSSPDSRRRTRRCA